LQGYLSVFVTWGLTKAPTKAKSSDRFKISFAEHFVVPACAGMTNYVCEKFKDLSTAVEMTTQRTPHRFRGINLWMPAILPAICTLLYGLADFRRKKHGNLYTPHHYPTDQGRIKRERWDK